MPASTQTLPANNTDSFVFSMLKQHCDYVSPELEQAYLDPFVMMLTACAVPVLIRIADMLMAAIGTGTAAASKRIEHCMGGADDRTGAMIYCPLRSLSINRPVSNTTEYAY